MVEFNDVYAFDEHGLSEFLYMQEQPGPPDVAAFTAGVAAFVLQNDPASSISPEGRKSERAEVYLHDRRARVYAWRLIAPAVGLDCSTIDSPVETFGVVLTERGVDLQRDITIQSSAILEKEKTLIEIAENPNYTWLFTPDNYPAPMISDSGIYNWRENAADLAAILQAALELRAEDVPDVIPVHLDVMNSEQALYEEKRLKERQIEKELIESGEYRKLSGHDSLSESRTTACSRQRLQAATALLSKYALF
ncbi:MAG: hypothetical protein JWN38_484 [Candidatus Saccharibacteria bacterium]|nr:hypothetical protein [Candidatus Saccharibacteria bacterium]